MKMQSMDIFIWMMILFCFWFLSYLHKHKHVDFGIRTLLAVGLGIWIGFLGKGGTTSYTVIGVIYTNLIRAIVVPLLFFSIISSITNMQDESNMKKIGIKSVVFLLLNTLIASILTLFVALLTKVGYNFPYTVLGEPQVQKIPDFMDTIVSMFPSNLAQHWVNGEVIPIVLFAIIVALSYNKLSVHKEVQIFKQCIDAGNRVMEKVAAFVISFTPYAVLVLIAQAVTLHDIQDLLPLLGVLFLVYILCAMQIVIVESCLLLLVGKVSPIPFLKAIYPAAVVAFTSQSSMGTIPITIKQLTKKVGVDENIATFTTTLGANLGMPGCAGIWPMLLAVFAIHVTGIAYQPSQYVFLIILTLVVAIGTVGVPGTATITATAVFVAAGLPVEIIVLLTPISTLADMARTATNVVGAATAATLVAKSEQKLNLDIYHQTQKQEEAE